MKEVLIGVFCAILFVGIIIGIAKYTIDAGMLDSEPTTTTLPDSIRLQDLNEVMKQTRIVRIKPDSCQWVMSPYIGETTGITLIHHPVCDNPKHKK